MDTAERLFGEFGYSATSLRQIIAEAGVNLAAIHYHFGSKEELLDEVILRKATPVNAERMARLDALKQPTVQGVLEAFLLPMADAADRDPQFVKLMGRLLSEGLLQDMVKRHFQHVVARVFGALRAALPELSDEDFLWRVHFMMGAMAHTMSGQPDLTGLPVQAAGFHVRIERLIQFLAGGFRMEAKKK